MIIHEIEQGSEAWFNLRAGLPTASKAKNLVTSKGEPSKSMKGYALELAYSAYAGQPLDEYQGNSSTERGTLLEPEARVAYEFIKGIETKQVGFITDDLKRYGISPDSLIDDDGMVEIKCQEAKGHTTTLVYFAKHGKLPTDHIAQVQMQMFVAEREWCDTCHYHPSLPFKIVRSYPDPVIVRQLQIQLANVLEERDRVIEILKAS